VWEYLIVDEAHRLKNRDAKALVALEQLTCAGTKLALTGTPLQNHVSELWSMLHFLEPERFDDVDAFVTSYSDMQSAAQVQSLTDCLRPYLLRRTKGDVDLGLTPMEETLISVDITNFQKRCYRAILERNRTVLLRGAEASGAGPSFNNVSMQLRHCCNHPFLIKGVVEAEGLSDTDDATWLAHLVSSSGKMLLLDKLLPHLREQGHRVLLFSQFTMLLDLIEEYIELKGLAYERLDGSVTGDKRQAAIDRFCEPGSDTFLFLLGTRAGGVGINLVAADTVIIYDPDWNPQNDLQAQARCHRIGQTKTVRFYRLMNRVPHAPLPTPPPLWTRGRYASTGW
jgi:SNF2 family DNA or RNA helicase